MEMIYLENIKNIVKILQDLYEKTGFAIYGDRDMALISNDHIHGAIDFDDKKKQYRFGIYNKDKRSYESWTYIKDII